MQDPMTAGPAADGLILSPAGIEVFSATFS
jgi:hypothetical protein